MKVSNLKRNIVDILTKFIKSEKYKYLRIVYLIAFVFFAIVYLFGARTGGDTSSYYSAKDVILNGSFDHLRTPLYPIFLAITKQRYITIVVQWLIFFVSITFLYKTLEYFKISSRLIFVAMIIYVCHPIFIYYQNQIIPEALCISLSSIFAYYLVTFIKTKKKSYCWIFHAIILCLILLKPGCIFLLAIPVTFLFYLFFAKRKLILSYILPFLLTFLLVGSYGFAIKKTYGVFNFSSVSDINLYWMLREQDRVNLNSIENDDLKSFVADKINIKYAKSCEYFVEAKRGIIDKYGWKELHNIVQYSLKGNYKSIFFDMNNLERINANLEGYVGRSSDFFNRIASSPFPYFNFYVLIYVLFFYFALIAKQIYRLRTIPVISILFLFYIVANFVSFVLTSPGNYGRLIVPSISIILIVCTQCIEQFVLFIQKKENQFKLV